MWDHIGEHSVKSHRQNRASVWYTKLSNQAAFCWSEWQINVAILKLSKICLGNLTRNSRSHRFLLEWLVFACKGKCEHTLKAVKHRTRRSSSHHVFKIQTHCFEQCLELLLGATDRCQMVQPVCIHSYKTTCLNFKDVARCCASRPLCDHLKSQSYSHK